MSNPQHWTLAFETIMNVMFWFGVFWCAVGFGGLAVVALSKRAWVRRPPQTFSDARYRAEKWERTFGREKGYSAPESPGGP